MKKFFSGIVLLAVGLLFVGCELEGNDYGDLRFENASTRTVQVISRTTEWGGFDLAPGQSKKLYNIDNPDYDWEPKTRIDVGVSSTSRNVIFVERERDLPEDPVVIIQEVPAE